MEANIKTLLLKAKNISSSLKNKEISINLSSKINSAEKSLKKEGSSLRKDNMNNIKSKILNKSL